MRQLSSSEVYCNAWLSVRVGFDVYLATDLRTGETSREDSEQDMQLRSVTEGESRRMVLAGDVVEGATLAAYSLLLPSR